MASLLLAAPDARAGSWQFTCTGSGSKSGTVSYTFYGTPGGGSGSTPWTPPTSTTGTYFQIPSFGYDSLPGGTFGSVPTNDSQSQSVTVSPVLTVTWVPDPSLPSDPAPTSVIMSETSSATWTAQYTDGTPGVYYGGGAADDGLGDPLVKTYSGGAQLGGTMSCTNAAHYSTPSVSGGSVTVPSHTFTASANASLPNDGKQGAMNVGCLFGGYSLVLAVPTVQIGGTYDPAHGDYRVLTGQPITATLQGIPSGFNVTKYTWAGVFGTCFKNYDPTLPSNQLTPLGSSDLSGPAKGSNTVAALNFYDSKQEDLTVTCTATVLAPDGTTLSITVTSPKINVLKPTATWGVDPKTVPANGTANSNQIGFHDDSATSLSYGVNTTWYPAKLSVPSPFTGGQGCFAQLVTPNATITRTPTGTGASSYSLKIMNAQGVWIAPGTGLDGKFPYASGFTTDANGNLTGIASDSSWQASGTGASGDNPKGQETTSDVDNGGTMWTSSSISDSFTTWLMYKPDGGVWIPVQSATWKASGNASGGPNNWSATGNYTPPFPTDAKDPPQWSTVISGQQYRP